jgi:hypothetical protein
VNERARLRAAGAEPRRGFGAAIVVPVAFYLAGTLGVPVANGSATRAGFWVHGAVVLAVVVGCLLVRVAGSAATAAFRESKSGSG